MPKDSPITSVAELKGKKLAFFKGSNAHYLVVKALEKAGVRYDEVEKAFLTPSDGRAAFESKSIDAWAVWDPFLAAAQAATGARTLVTGEGLAFNYQYYLGRRDFVAAEPKVVDALIEAVAEIDAALTADPAAAAAQLGPATGIPVAVVETAIKRQGSGVKRIDHEIVARPSSWSPTPSPPSA